VKGKEEDVMGRISRTLNITNFKQL